MTELPSETQAPLLYKELRPYSITELNQRTVQTRSSVLGLRVYPQTKYNASVCEQLRLAMCGIPPSPPRAALEQYIPEQDSERCCSVPPCAEGVGGRRAAARSSSVRASPGAWRAREWSGEKAAFAGSSWSPVIPRSPRAFPATAWAFQPPDPGARTQPARSRGSWGSRTVKGRGGVAVSAPSPNLKI